MGWSERNLAGGDAFQSRFQIRRIALHGRVVAACRRVSLHFEQFDGRLDTPEIANAPSSTSTNCLTARALGIRVGHLRN
jgi:hypothetical protein